MRFQKYQDERVLKLTEITEVFEYAMLGLVETVEDDQDFCFDETEIAGKSGFNRPKNTFPSLPMFKMQ